MPFVEGADYIYHLNHGSRSHSAEALQRARAGYLQILELVDKRDWPQPRAGPGAAGVQARTWPPSSERRPRDAESTWRRDGARRLGALATLPTAPSRASRRRSQAITGLRQQHHPGLADDLAGQIVEVAEGEVEENRAVDHQPDDAAGQHGQQKPRRCSGVNTARSTTPRAGRRRPRQPQAPPAPAMPTAAFRPGWPLPPRQAQPPLHQSRSTRARPTISTPLGAISPGATGIRQGPLGTHTVPTCPISQLAAGMQSPKPARKAKPSSRCRSTAV